jgi:hypothetical protein
MNVNVDLSGNDELINQLKSQGFGKPVIAKMGLDMSGNIKTGQTGTNSIFPVVTSFKVDQLNIKVGEKDIPMPAKTNVETIIYGHVGPDGKLKADSLNGKNVKDTSEKKITQLMNSIQNKIKFPDEALKIGDTFTQDVPINLPMAGNGSGNTNIKAVYKLISISNGQAYFDIIQTADINLDLKGIVIAIKGNGTGKLIYSIKDSFPLDYTSNLNLKVDGNINTLIIKGTAVIAGEYKYVIQ